MKETQTAQGGDADQTSLVLQSGYELLTTPSLNKGTAFTDQERLEFDLHGLLPSHISTLDEQIERRLIAIRNLPSDLERYVFLSITVGEKRPSTKRAERDVRQLARQSKAHPDCRSTTIKSRVTKISLALSSCRDKYPLAATAKMAILIVAVLSR